MITRSDDWKHHLAHAVRDPEELLARLELPASLLPAATAASGGFGLRVPESYLRRIRPGDAADPLLRQVLPLAEELADAPGFTADPVGDGHASRGHGLLHKYQGRVLLITTGACAVHCRYCFRRHFPYADDQAGPSGVEAALALIAADPSVSEVILSGGDPLVLDDRRLAGLSARLAAIPHLRRLRIHTRLPVVLPERVDAALLGWLTASRLKPVVVIHANHPHEIGDEVAAALARLHAAGVALFNQAVLLRGVNDDAAVLAELCERLFEHGVVPYYLHLLDRVAGAAHFEVPEPEALELMEALRIRLPGYLVPRLVRESPGAPYKRPIGDSTL